MQLRDTESRLVGCWPARLAHASSGRSLDVERGILLVPSCRQQAESPSLALSFVRVPAKRDRGLAPLIVLAGGPGVSAIGAFETGFFEHVERLSEICDVVTFDQRGCHSALPDLGNPFRPAYDLDTVLTRESFLVAQRENAGRLASYWRDRGVDLNAYNTIESAADVDDLRKALGVDKINLHGASYGSHLGLTVIKQHAEQVERAILCIVEGLDDTHKLPANTDRHFRHLAELARAAPNLGGQCPDLFAEISDVLDAFQRTPVRLKLSGIDRPLHIGKFAVQTILGNALGSIHAIKGLPDFVRQLARRDLSTLTRRLDRWLKGPGSHGMMLAMDFASGASPERLALIESQRVDALLDDSFNLPFPFIGDVLGVDDLGADFRAPVQTDTPALFCCGTLDGRTPISNAEAVQRGFSESRLIVVEGATHETPSLLLDAQMDFLLGSEVSVERLARPFAFDPIRSTKAK